MLLVSGSLLIPALFVVETFRPQDIGLVVTMLRFVARRLADYGDAATDRDRRNAVIVYVSLGPRRLLFPG